MQYKCPVRKKCKCIFVCTYDRKEGTDFNFTPKCYVERKKRSDTGTTKTPIKKVKRVSKPVVKTPKVSNLVTVHPPLPRKPNIWDDI